MKHNDCLPSSVLKMLNVARPLGFGEQGYLSGCDVEVRKCTTCGQRWDLVHSCRNASCVVRERRLRPFWDNLVMFEGPVWSERVVECMTRNGLCDFRAHRVPLFEQVTLKALEGVAGIPVYYFIEITGRIEIDHVLYGDGDGWRCAECGLWTTPSRKMVPGDKIYAIVDRGGRLPDFARQLDTCSHSVYCRPRFAELVTANGFTGFMFTPMAPGIPFDRNGPDWMERFRKAARLLYPYNSNP